MSSYVVAKNVAGVNTANTVLAELRAASTSRAKLVEFGITMAVLPTTAPRFVLCAPSNTPAGGTNTVPEKEDPADAAAASQFITTGWTTAPTFATGGPWKRVMGLPLTLGAGLIWTFPKGLMIATSGSLLLADLNASGATLGSFDIYASWEE